MYFTLKRHNKKTLIFSKFDSLWKRFIELTDGNHILLGDAVFNYNKEKIMEKTKERKSVSLRAMSGDLRGEDFTISVENFDDDETN